LNADAPVPGRGPWRYDDFTVTPGEVYSYRIACIIPGGGERIFGPVVVTAPSLKFALFPAAPNPSRGSTSLRFDLPQRGKVVLKIYGVTGQLVRTLIDGPILAGHHEATWDGRNNLGHTAASGMYLVRINWNDRSVTRRLVLLR
jgi:hypothetical protein